MQTNYKKRGAGITTEESELFLEQNDLKTYAEGVRFLLDKLAEPGDGP